MNFFNSERERERKKKKKKKGGIYQRKEGIHDEL